MPTGGVTKMPTESKGKSPFYPGQPVPLELFVGRATEIDKILKRGAGQVAQGKPIAIFVQGEYGIGKSSIAVFTQAAAAQSYGLHPIYLQLGGVQSLEEVGTRLLAATIQSGAFWPTRWEAIRNWLADYIGEQSVAGVKLHAEKLKMSGPSIAAGVLPFLAQTYERLQPSGVRGLFVVMDEINGITGHPQFAHFIKGLVDTNAIAPQPVPLLLTLCGVEERRRQLIQQHPPVDRIFDITEIEPMSASEMREFFSRAFESVSMSVDPKALEILVLFSAGLPKIMHLIGDQAFWLDRDGVIDQEDAAKAVFAAADDVGKKYVDQQVYKALKSADYHSILRKVADVALEPSFHKADVEKNLTASQRGKLNNFLQRLKRLNVLRSGDARGEYVFTHRMVAVYIWMESHREGP